MSRKIIQFSVQFFEGSPGVFGEVITIANDAGISITAIVSTSNTWTAQIQSIVTENTATTLNITSNSALNESANFTLTYDDPATA